VCFIGSSTVTDLKSLDILYDGSEDQYYLRLCLISTSVTSLSRRTSLFSPLDQYVTSHLISSNGETSLCLVKGLVSLVHHRLGHTLMHNLVASLKLRYMFNL
jgi:hypothetical protein